MELRVLLVGKRAKVLTRLQQALGDVGVEADIADLTELTELTQPTEPAEPAVPTDAIRQTAEAAGADRTRWGSYGAVGFGRAVSEQDRARITSALETANPDIVAVAGLAPIIPLLVAQFEQALDRRPAHLHLLSGFTVRDGRLVFDVRSRCRVQVTAYRLDRLYRTHITEVIDEELPPGSHAVALSRRVARASEAYAVARADNEVHVAVINTRAGRPAG